MDMQSFALFLKLAREDYRLSEEQVTRLSRRMMSDEREFLRIWELYKSTAKKTKSGVDEFKTILSELLS